MAVLALSLSGSATALQSNEPRPEANGGYYDCNGSDLIAELGISFLDDRLPELPTVFHVVPTKKGKSIGEKVLDFLTQDPDGNFVVEAIEGFLNLGSVTKNVVLGWFGLANEEKPGDLKEDFIECVIAHPGWYAHWTSVVILGTPQLTSKLSGVRNWESIYLQLYCHSIAVAFSDALSSRTGLALMRGEGPSLGGPTWDLEGHRSQPSLGTDIRELVFMFGCNWK